jgi:hypothetical protein
MITHLDSPNVDGNSYETQTGTGATKVAMFSEEFEKWDPSSFVGQGNFELIGSLSDLSPSVQTPTPTHRAVAHNFDASANAPALKDTHFSSTPDPPKDPPPKYSKNEPLQPPVASPNVDLNEYAQGFPHNAFHH